MDNLVDGSFDFNDNSIYNILDLINTSIYWKDERFCYLGCNRYVLNMFGMKDRSEIIGKNDYDLLPKDEADRLRAIDKLVLKDGYYEGEEICSTIDRGEARVLMTTKTRLLDYFGNIVILGNSIDITDTKKRMELKKLQAVLEEKVKTTQIIDLVDASIYWKDINGRFLGCNEYVLNMFGMSDRLEIIGKNEYDLLPIDEAMKITEVDRAVLKNGYYKGEEQFSIKDGKEMVVLTTKNPLLGQDGKVIGIIGTSIDITAEKEAEKLKLENEIHKKSLEQEAKYRKIAEQVAHDIRSPISSQEIALSMCTNVPEELRIVLRDSGARIKDIANNFLNQYKTEDELGRNAEPLLVSVAAEMLLTEKKYQYANLPISFNLEFKDFGYNPHFAFIYAAPSDIKRTLSNLINNAVDAISNDKKDAEVKLIITAKSDKVRITIRDNGAGMTPEVKEKILAGMSVTAGKEDGYGIGFGQIRDTLAAANGKLRIDSKIGVGTDISLTFSRCDSPGWIKDKIELYSNSIVVIVDDDTSIHGAWDNRFASFKASFPSLQIYHFQQGNEAINFINSLSGEDKKKVFLLTDYELLHQNIDGLKIIALCQVPISTLVTSHYADHKVQQQTLEYNSKVLPKQLATHIAITVSNPNTIKDTNNSKVKIDAVLAEDDDMLRGLMIQCHFKGKNVAAYACPEEVLANIGQYPKNTKVFLDHTYAGSSITGIDIAKKLHEDGFTHLHLVSGWSFKDGELPDYLVAIPKNDLDTIKNWIKVE